MNVQTRFLALLGLLSVLFGAGVVAHQFHQRTELRALLRDSVEQHQTLSRNVLNLRNTPLMVFAEEMSRWDEMVTFVTGAAKTRGAGGGAPPVLPPSLETWADIHIDGGLASYQLDAAWVFDPSGCLLYFAHSPNGAVLRDLPYASPETTGAALFSPPAAPPLRRFFLTSPHAGTPVEMYAARIVRSPDTARTGESFGYLFAARIWSKEQLAEIGRILGAEVTLDTSAHAPHTAPGDGNDGHEADLEAGRLVYCAPLPNVQGQPAWSLTISRTAAWVARQRATSRLQGAAFATFAVVLLALSALCVRRWVSTPLHRVMHALDTGEEAILAPLLSTVAGTTETGRSGAARSEFTQLARLVVDSQRQRREVERQKAELESSRRRLALHVERSPVAFVEGDAQGRIVGWNPAAETIFGYTAAEAIGRDALELLIPASIVPADTRGQAVADTNAMLQGLCPTESSGVYENATRDGRIIHCEWHSTLLVDEHGEVSGIVSLVRDVTEERRTQETQRRQRAFFRSVLDAVPDMIVVKDTRGVITLANNTAAALLSTHGATFDGQPVDSEQLEGKHLSECLPNPALVEALLEVDRRVLAAPGETLQTEETVRLPDGSVRYIYSTRRAIPGPDGGAPDQVLSVITDVTERKRTEEKMRHLMGSARCLLFSSEVLHIDTENPSVTDLEWRNLYYDGEAAQRFLPLDVPPGKSYAEVSYTSRHPEDSERINLYGATKIRAGEDYSQEYRVRGADGLWHWMREHMSVQVLEPGRRWHTVAVVLDVTESKL